MTAVAVALKTARNTIPREVRELVAVMATAAAHLAWPLTGQSRFFLVIPLVLFWVGHVWIASRNDPGALKQWGLQREGLGPSTLAVAVLIGVTGPAMVGWGLAHGVQPTPTMAVAVLMYPLWGLIQQLLVQGMVTGGLVRLPGRLGHPVSATVVSASLFGAVHLAEPQLVVGTFLLGLVLAPIWLRWRNIWPLAFAHGWLGTAMYYFVMMRDPMASYALGT